MSLSEYITVLDSIRLCMCMYVYIYVYIYIYIYIYIYVVVLINRSASDSNKCRIVLGLARHLVGIEVYIVL